MQEYAAGRGLPPTHNLALPISIAGSRTGRFALGWRRTGGRCCRRGLPRFGPMPAGHESRADSHFHFPRRVAIEGKREAQNAGRRPGALL